VAFNQYSPISFETDRLRQKLEAGAEFVVTQPVIGKDPNVDLLTNFSIPVVIEAWMSKKVNLLYRSVRKEKEERAQGYDPVDNLRVLHDSYPERTVYLSMLSFSQDWKLILPRL
jgi:methylenetetrahydrofolate reductase (NADPH)